MRQLRAGGPFTRLIEVDAVPDAGLDTVIEASAEECAAVAQAIGTPSVAALAAHIKIVRRHGGRLQVEGEVTARVTQICVVSLDPFESDVTHPIEVTFAPAASSARPDAVLHGHKLRHRRGERQEAPPPVPSTGDGEDDPPDPIIDGRIDLGAVAVEFLTLALDFYPRKPGVHFSDVVTGDPGPTPSAFAALERFKDRS